MLSNAYFLAKIRFDTAENEPAKKLQKIFEKCIFEKCIFEKCAPCWATAGGDPDAAEPGLDGADGSLPQRVALADRDCLERRFSQASKRA